MKRKIIKRKLLMLLGILGITASALAFTASRSQSEQNSCPMWGTPECPVYPGCCDN